METAGEKGACSQWIQASETSSSVSRYHANVMESRANCKEEPYLNVFDSTAYKFARLVQIPRYVKYLWGGNNTVTDSYINIISTVHHIDPLSANKCLG